MKSLYFKKKLDVPLKEDPYLVDLINFINVDNFSDRLIFKRFYTKRF